MPGSGTTLTREEWLKDLDERPINKQFTDRNGLFIRINPILDGGDDDKSVTAFRHVLVECDSGTHEEQLGRIRAIGLAITAIIHSGNKSIHAWLRVDAKNEADYRERVACIFNFCEQALGMKLDPKNRNPSRYSRMSDVRRALKIEKNEKGIPRVTEWGQQRLLAVNVPGKLWDEWRESVASMDATAPKPLPAFESWEDLKEADMPELKIIIPGVLNQGAKMTVGGASKAGKTWLLMDLAFAIATGRPWLGLETKEGKVLYVNLEIQWQYFRKRCEHILCMRKMSPKVPNFMSWTLRGHFMTAELFKEAILEGIGDEKFDVIFIDPLYKLLNGADANKAGDMQKILAELEQIAERAGAALIYADHFAKGNMAERSAIDRISGSGVNARDPDVICTLTENGTEGCLSANFVLRNMPPMADFAVGKMEKSPLFERRTDIDPADLKRPGAKKEYKEEDLLAHLSAEEWVAEV
jgi:regulatory protein RepA